MSPAASASRVLEEALDRTKAPISGRVLASSEAVLEAVPSVKEELFDKVPFVLVDLSLGLEEGRSVVETIKADPNRCRAPVVVLAPEEHTGAGFYDAFANAVVPWPASEKAQVETLEALLDFWCRVPALP